MPACLVFTTFHALDLLASLFGGRPKDSFYLGWLGVTAVATCALGILDHKLSGPPSSSDKHAFASNVFGFVGFQVTGVIPTLLLSAWLIRRWIGG
jgi:hypothetical protein